MDELIVVVKEIRVWDFWSKDASYQDSGWTLACEWPVKSGVTPHNDAARA